MKRIRAALIGLGRIGWSLEKDRLRYHPCTHAGALRHLSSKFEIVGGCDLQDARRSNFAAWMHTGAEHSRGNPMLFADVTDLASAIGHRGFPVDLAVIATGPESHPAIFAKLLRSGVQRFLIEKPVALASPPARRMLKMAKSANAIVHVNFERRYHPAYRLVEKVIRDGRFGGLRHMEGRVLVPSLNRDALLEDAVHWIDLMLWFAGQPTSSISRYRLDSRQREKTSLHIFEYPGFEAVLESGGDRKYFEFVMRLDFEKGRVIAGNDGHFHYASRASTKYAGFRDLAPVRTRIPLLNPWVEMYREIARGRDCSSSLENAVAGLALIDQCRRFKKSSKTHAD